MWNEKYQVVILKEDKVEGKLYLEDKEIWFNPLTVLADLRCQKSRISCDSKQEINSFNTEEGISTIDGFLYSEEWGFGEKIAIPDREREYYSKMIRDLKRIIIDKIRIITIAEVEYLKILYGITYELTLSVKKKRTPLMNILKISDDTFFHQCHWGLTEALDMIRGGKLEEAHVFIYDCNSLKDVIFSIFHFLVFNGYKFTQCAHCSEYFATKTYKIKYCDRKSPYNKCEHLCCEETVRYLRQKLRMQESRVVSNLTQHHYERLNDFYKERHKYKTFKEMSLVTSFRECEEFLYNTDRWYK